MRRRLSAAQVCQIISELPSEDSGQDDSASSDEESVGLYEQNNDGNTDSDSSNSPEDGILDTGMSNDSASDNASQTTSSEYTCVAKDGTKWEKMTTSRVGRAAANNVFKGVPGLSSSVKASIRTPYDAWKKFIDERILRIILECTLKHAASSSVDACENFHLDLNDLEKFIGIQYARGIYGKNQPLHFLWNKEFGPPLFGKIMSRDRFKTVLQHLRFDIKDTRSLRLTEDKFAHVSEVFELFRVNCTKVYTPNMSLTIDEQLLPLKTRCRLITFMPNKPDKYGLKFWVMVDTETKYVVNILPYLGAQEREQRGTRTLAEDVVSRLVDPIVNKGYNICCDNFFTSLKNAMYLKEKKTTIVGTMRKNRRELANEMTRSDKELHTSDFYYEKETKAVVVSYQCKKNKSVCLLSTMHDSVACDDTQKRKPAIINFYNHHKVGVDVFDQMARQYSTLCASFRWPLAVWSNILDISAINAWIVYKEATKTSPSRRAFILELIKELTGIACEKRASPSASGDARLFVSPSKRKKCQQSKCRNCTSSLCQVCKKLTCGNCATDKKVVLVVCKYCEKYDCV